MNNLFDSATTVEKRIDMLRLLKELQHQNESPGDTILRALHGLRRLPEIERVRDEWCNEYVALRALTRAVAPDGAGVTEAEAQAKAQDIYICATEENRSLRERVVMLTENSADENYLQEVADGAWGDDPRIRGLAGDRLAVLAQAQEPGEDKRAAVPKGFKPVYVKRWRTLIVVSEAHADKVREALAPPPQVDSGREDERAVIDMLCLCGELGGKQNNETYAQYLRRLIDEFALHPEQSEGQRA